MINEPKQSKRNNGASGWSVMWLKREELLTVGTYSEGNLLVV